MNSDVLSFTDLLNEQSIVLAKEQSDRDMLNAIGAQSVLSLKPKLVEWVMKGCPNAYPILNVNIQPPAVCGDGVSRDLSEYIQYCSGKTIHEHVGLLQAKLPDMELSFANFSGSIAIVVSKSLSL